MNLTKLLIFLVVAILVITPLCTIAGAQMTAKIVYPKSGGNVGPTEPMSGTATAPPSGQELRMALYIPSVGKYYPQEEPIVVNPDGSWYYRCSIGSSGDNGKQFQIIVVSADSNAQSAFDSYIANGKKTGDYPGMAALPGGATNLASATVTRVASDVKPTADPPISPSPSPTTTPLRDTIREIAASNANLTTLISLLSKADLNTTLDGPGNFTLLAPSNDAFAKLNQSTLANLQNNTTALRTTLLYHVIPKKMLANNFSGNGTITTVNGLSLPYSVNGTKVIFGSGNNTATVTKADINATNGEIQIIDGVLTPPPGITATSPTASPSGGTPGFEAVYAVAGLLVVAYLVMRRRR